MLNLFQHLTNLACLLHSGKTLKFSWIIRGVGGVTSDLHLTGLLAIARHRPTENPQIQGDIVVGSESKIFTPKLLQKWHNLLILFRINLSQSLEWLLYLYNSHSEKSLLKVIVGLKPIRKLNRSLLFIFLFYDNVIDFCRYLAYIIIQFF